MNWNFGDLLDAADAVIPGDVPALLHENLSRSWQDFGSRSNCLAQQLLARNGGPGEKVAFYMRNSPAYLESLAACLKARQVHVNVNYRYLEDELAYVIDNSDAKTLIFDAEFAEAVGKLHDRIPKVVTFIQADTPHGPDSLAPFATAFEALATEGDGKRLKIERSPDDLLFLYTGGTTGMPKAVMWPHKNLWDALGRGASLANGNYRAPTFADHVAVMRDRPGVRQLPACPLMHGTGLFVAISTLCSGGSVVTLPSLTFDPVRVWNAVEQHGVQSLTIVGDAFGKPLLQALDDDPGRWDLSSLGVIISSGIMFSPEVKRGLLGHHPEMAIVDTFGSSEAIGFGSSVATARHGAELAKFRLGENCKVFTEDHREVMPGSDEVGFVARTGSIPIGYYKDEEKTEKTFPQIDGVRYSIPGDFCRVEDDGSLTLLGRGNVCINTGGEKVYPEEVEEMLKTHPDVYDAVVVGVEDPKWGQAVTAMVELRQSRSWDEEAFRSHVRERLAAFKVPKHCLQVPTMGRAANGKADYQRLQREAAERLG